MTDSEKGRKKTKNNSHDHCWCSGQGFCMFSENCRIQLECSLERSFTVASAYGLLMLFGEDLLLAMLVSTLSYRLYSPLLNLLSIHSCIYFQTILKISIYNLSPYNLVGLLTGVTTTELKLENSHKSKSTHLTYFLNTQHPSSWICSQPWSLLPCSQ